MMLTNRSPIVSRAPVTLTHVQAIIHAAEIKESERSLALVWYTSERPQPAPAPSPACRPVSRRPGARLHRCQDHVPRGSRNQPPEQHSEAGEGSRALPERAFGQPRQKRPLWALRSIAVANPCSTIRPIEYQDESCTLEGPRKLRHGFRVQHMPAAFVIADRADRDARIGGEVRLFPSEQRARRLALSRRQHPPDHRPDERQRPFHR